MMPFWMIFILYVGAAWAESYEQILNPGFEQGDEYWSFYSETFDTPICPRGSQCGLGSPASGQGWLLLGGDGQAIASEGILLDEDYIIAPMPEDARAEFAGVSQKIDLPKSDRAYLKFKIKRIPGSKTLLSDFFAVELEPENEGDNLIVFTMGDYLGEFFVYPLAYEDFDYSQYIEVKIELNELDLVMGQRYYLNIYAVIAPYDLEGQVVEQTPLFLVDDLSLTTDSNEPVDPNPPEESPNAVDNADFESGNEDWQVTTNLDQPVICNLENCSLGQPHSGEGWAALGGSRVGDFVNLSQEFWFDVDSTAKNEAELSFYLLTQVVGGTNKISLPLAGLSVFIDAELVFQTDGHDAQYYGQYQQIQIDVSDLAAGQHVLHFNSLIKPGNQGQNADAVYFLIDDIKLGSANPSCNGDDAVIGGEIYGQYNCQASQSISTQGETIIKSGAEVELEAPKIELNPLFKVEEGAQLKIKTAN